MDMPSGVEWPTRMGLPFASRPLAHVTLTNGYNLIANPLNGTNNAISTVIPTAPDGATLYRFNKAAQGFFQADTYFNFAPPDNGWYDGSFNPSTAVLAPGEAFFIRNPLAPATITFVGDVPQGNLTNTVVNHYGFYSSIVPQAGTISTLGFPGGAGSDGMVCYTWSLGGQKYNQALTYFNFTPPDNGWYDGSFNPSEPSLGVAEGCVLYNPNAALAWGRTFSVN